MATSVGTSELDAKVSCEDFQTFQVVLKQMRTLDDRLIHALNTSIPTDSFRHKVDPSSKCKELFEQMLTAHTQREDLIKRCISKKSQTVSHLRDQRRQDRDNVSLLGEVRKEQNQLRLMQNELGIEEVVQDTANKVFYERCRLFYLPPKDQ